MEIKKEFLKIEKERFVTFMDALMAIIMTIMVLEIKIPAVETLTDETLRQELHKAVTPLIGFLVSFGTLTMIWISHNDLMKDINGITKQFALLNFLLILVIALVPFSTALGWGYSTTSLAVFIYALNIFLLSAAFSILYGFSVAKKLIPVTTSQYMRVKKIVGFSGLVLLVIAMFFSFVNPGFALFLIALIPLAHTIPIVFAYKFKS
ncbi:MAG TPA: TMEM175 family protein [Chitinophagaceae bacterium]|nr:TMEM175 family protein [Chitinophagaceae bacterium]